MIYKYDLNADMFAVFKRLAEREKALVAQPAEPVIRIHKTAVRLRTGAPGGELE